MERVDRLERCPLRHLPVEEAVHGDVLEKNGPGV